MAMTNASSDHSTNVLGVDGHWRMVDWRHSKALARRKDILAQ